MRVEAAAKDQGLTRASATRAMVAACTEVGLNSQHAELLRLGENAIYALASEDAVVRVARADTDDIQDKVAKELAVSRWLVSNDFPAVQPRDDLPQPVRADGRLVTFWEYVPPSPGDPDIADLAALLRALHELPEPDFALPSLDPFPSMRRRLSRVDGVSKRDVDFLAEACDRCEDAFRAVVDRAPTGLIHGDAHRGNLLIRGDQVLLIDYEAVAVGPRDWDLIPTATAVDRFGLSRVDYATFCKTYGRDVVESPGYGELRAVRELGMVTWLMQNAQEGPPAEEFVVRMESLRKEDRERRWHAL